MWQATLALRRTAAPCTNSVVLLHLKTLQITLRVCIPSSIVLWLILIPVMRLIQLSYILPVESLPGKHPGVSMFGGVSDAMVRLYV